MRITITEIENKIYQYFYIYKYEQNIYEEIYELLELEELALFYDDKKTIDLVELIEKIDFLYSMENMIERNRIILIDFKEFIFSSYDINENLHKYQYASLPTLKTKKTYKRIDIINNPNIKCIVENNDYDLGLVKINMTTIDGYSKERYVTDWKIKNDECKKIGSFNCSGGTDWFNKKYIIKAQEYSK